MHRLSKDHRPTINQTSTTPTPIVPLAHFTAAAIATLTIVASTLSSFPLLTEYLCHSCCNVCTVVCTSVYLLYATVEFCSCMRMCLPCQPVCVFVYCSLCVAFEVMYCSKVARISKITQVNANPYKMLYACSQGYVYRCEFTTSVGLLISQEATQLFTD
uniref:Uncharacterized protein n=1 Tax=Octopus bimaculoides TaxID=37653 RepID=A0A0L8HMA5_OCTBM